MITLTRHSKASANGGHWSHGLDDRYQALFSRMTCAADGSSLNPCVGVISCSSGEGSSTVAANLAVWTARLGDKPALLVDADVGNPTVDRSFKIPRSPGLTDVLSDRCDLAACVQRSPIANLSIIAAGTQNGGGLAQYKFTKVAGLLDALRRDFAFIVVDLPAATELRSDVRLTGALDGVVLVIEAERTRIAVAQRVKKELVRANVNLLGLLLNKQPSRVPNWVKRRQ